MKIQNIENFGPIRIGGGFKGTISSSPHDYPLERLAEFINFFPKDAKEISEFCNRYQIIYPLFEPEKIIHNFIKEQVAMRKIVKKLRVNNLSEFDLKTINKRLNKIVLEVKLPNQKGKTNVPNMPAKIKDKFKPSHLIIVKRHENSIVSLWEDLIRHFIDKQDVRWCLNCGNIYILANNHDKKYCSDSCRNTHNKNKNRKLKKFKIPQS